MRLSRDGRLPFLRLTVAEHSVPRPLGEAATVLLDLERVFGRRNGAYVPTRS